MKPSIANTAPSLDTSGAATQEAMLFAIFCFLDDLHRLENYVLSLWESYHAGKMDLVTVSIATNTSFELATQLATELELEYPRMNSWVNMINNLYMSQEVRFTF